MFPQKAPEKLLSLVYHFCGKYSNLSAPTRQKNAARSACPGQRFCLCTGVSAKKCSREILYCTFYFFCKPCSLKPFFVAVVLPLPTILCGRCAAAADRFPWPLRYRCRPLSVAVVLPLPTVFHGRCAAAVDRFPWPLCCRCRPFSAAVVLPAADRFPWPLCCHYRPFSAAVALPLPTAFRGRCAARCRPLSVAVALPLPTVFRGCCAAMSLF